MNGRGLPPLTSTSGGHSMPDGRRITSPPKRRCPHDTPQTDTTGRALKISSGPSFSVEFAKREADFHSPKANVAQGGALERDQLAMASGQTDMLRLAQILRWPQIGKEPRELVVRSSVPESRRQSGNLWPRPDMTMSSDAEMARASSYGGIAPPRKKLPEGIVARIE